MKESIKQVIRNACHLFGVDPVRLGKFRAGQKARSPIVESPYADVFAGHSLQVLIENFEFSTVLDIGSGEGRHADILEASGKQVTAVDFGRSVYYKQREEKRENRIGDYLEMDFDQEFDAVWASHVLEHQLNPNLFLKKIFNDLKDDGVLAITVPPLKHELVGGHVTLWNAGILLYQLVLAGFDCSGAHVRSYGYNVSVIVRKKKADLPKLDYDSGDIDRIVQFFPEGVREFCSGHISRLNWNF